MAWRQGFRSSKREKKDQANPRRVQRQTPRVSTWLTSHFLKLKLVSLSHLGIGETAVKEWLETFGSKPPRGAIGWTKIFRLSARVSARKVENEVNEHNNDNFAAFELKLIGDAKDVVLGSLGSGNDMWGQLLPLNMEFADDALR